MPSALMHLLALALFVTAYPSASHADSPQAAFAAGVAASKQGDYEQAVRAFRRARDQGLATPALHHNLGVAYYKLGRYELARAAFKRAAVNAGLRALSHYNLGLVAQAAGDGAAAAAWFRKAYEQAGTAQLRRLAAAQLGIAPPAVVPYTFYAEAFSGYDSNPRLAADDPLVDVIGDREGDAVYGALAAGRYLVSGDWSNGFALYGDAYIGHYADLAGEDIESLSAGGDLYRGAGGWQQRYRLVANHLRLGGEALANSIRASLRGRRPLGGDLALTLRLRAEYVDGDDGSGFDYLSGWEADTRVRLSGVTGALRWWVHYEFAYNDREDLSFDDDFFSVSPRRHELGVEFERPLIGRLRGMLDIAYSLRRYPDPEVRDAVEVDEREDHRLSAGLGLSHPIGTNWTGRIEVEYRRNASNFDAFDFERTVLLLSLARFFR